ncbi:putative inner membrane component of ABC transporter [Streptococcus pneumoniae]|nr:putative inner membrane component of ABC transporter [Streptococcus pneumoniae]CGE82187.1 putative inner membrane component of ABC transporter [Streptococcus pneumoniae]CGF11203.1 putative inner membrane component of ABC transporter [Streptococcus pneumoniae]CGF45838.1 putative inner membrane component of ABC transporter [Streptococcus pneumoniae]CGG34861.1 putative inner membrane component of ABC transporter [Streptococcus pneumoniae]
MAAIYATVYGIIFISVLPQIYLIYTSFLKTSGMVFFKGYSPNSYKLAFNCMGSAIFNTIRIPLIALVLVVLFATFISYLAVRKRNLFTNLIDSLSMVPYIVPGTVLGIAFISSFNTGLFGSGFLMITGTAFILIMSLSVRRLPYTIRSSVASLQQIAPSIEEAAESLGSSRLNTFAKITTPMMLSGIISGAILSWVTLISELSTSILYPPLQCQNKNNDCSYLYRGSQRKLRCSRSLVNYPDCSNSRFLALVYENL